MLDSIYHRTLKLLKIAFWREKSIFCYLLRNALIYAITLRY